MNAGSRLRLSRAPGWPGLLRAEHTREDRIYVTQLTLQLECALDNFGRHVLSDFRILHHQFAKVAVLLPGAHSMGLHMPVGILARDAVLDQVEKELSAEDQATGAFQVRFHP